MLSISRFFFLSFSSQSRGNRAQQITFNLVKRAGKALRSALFPNSIEPILAIIYLTNRMSQNAKCVKELQRAAGEQVDMENITHNIRRTTRLRKTWRSRPLGLCQSGFCVLGFKKPVSLIALIPSPLCTLLFALFFSQLGQTSLQAASTQTQTVTYNVPTVSVLTISGDVTFPNFTAPAGGQNFTSVISTSSTYSVSNNGGINSKKILAHLQSAMPTGLTLLATLTAPAGADSISNVTMTTSDQNLVTGIDNGAFSANQIKYTLSADVTQAQVASGQTLSVTYTLLSS